MKSTVFELIAWLTCARLISAQTLISALEARPELVLFNDYIQSVPGLLNTLTNATNYTLLAPSDTAMTRWLNDSSPPPSQDKIEATLYYHLLHGGYSLGSFSATPQFASSYLTNSSWTNVTGGAVVQLVESGGNPSMVSALGQHSSVTKGDLTANGGLFHIIDSVLALPQQELATATEAAMEFYIDIMTKGGYLTGKANDLNNALEAESDMTFFVPNSAAASDNFTSITQGWTSDQLNALLTYHAVPGIVAYSPSMRNGTVLPTVQGAEITIYMGENSTIYANNARILATDYLISNGVMHTIDGVLNPYNITKPSFPPSPKKRSALSIGAIIGIAIGGAAVLISALAGAFLCRRRSKRKSATKLPDTLPNTEPTESKIRKGSNGRAAEEAADKSQRRHSNRSATTKPTDSNSRNHSKRSTASGASKTSQRSSLSHKEYVYLEQVKKYEKDLKKYEKEKARVDVEVRRVVGEQLDAFRRSGYYDTSPGQRTVVPVVPVMPALELVELDAGFMGRHELSAGPHSMPTIEEMDSTIVEEMDAAEEPGEMEAISGAPSRAIPGIEDEGGRTPKSPISRASSWVKPAVEEEGGVTPKSPVSRLSSWAKPVVEEGGGVTPLSPVSRASSRAIPVTGDGAKAVSRASSRAMVLDRR